MKKKILVLVGILVLVVSVVAPAAVFAQTTTGVTLNVITGYTFTAPSAIVFGNKEPSATAYEESSVGHLSGNNSAGYTVVGTDANVETSAGYMLVGAAASPTNILGNKLCIGSTTEPSATADTTVTFLTTDAPTDAAVPLYASQVVAFDDAVADDYTLTVTFTVTAK